MDAQEGEIENGPAIYTDNWEDYTGHKLATDRLHVMNINYIFETPSHRRSASDSTTPSARAIFDDWKIAHLFTMFSGTPISPARLDQSD